MKLNLKIKPDIILVDDQMVFRQGLKAIINYENIGSVIGEAGSGEEFIHLLSTLRPDLVLMDIEMPQMNGLEAVRKSLEILPDLKIVAISAYSEEKYNTEMMKLGAKGFIPKSSGINELEYVIKAVMKGESCFDHRTTKGKQEDFFQNDNQDVISRENETRHSEKMRFFPWFVKQDINVRL